LPVRRGHRHLVPAQVHPPAQGVNHLQPTGHRLGRQGHFALAFALPTG
jgi:hypothetical protein